MCVCVKQNNIRGKGKSSDGKNTNVIFKLSFSDYVYVFVYIGRYVYMLTIRIKGIRREINSSIMEI